MCNYNSVKWHHAYQHLCVPFILIYLKCFFKSLSDPGCHLFLLNLLYLYSSCSLFWPKTTEIKNTFCYYLSSSPNMRWQARQSKGRINWISVRFFKSASALHKRVVFMRRVASRPAAARDRAPAALRTYWHVSVSFRMTDRVPLQPLQCVIL